MVALTIIECAVVPAVSHIHITAFFTQWEMDSESHWRFASKIAFLLY